MRRKRHAPPDPIVTVPEVALALGLTPKGAAALLKKHWYITRHFRRGVRYDQRVIDVLQELRGEQARPLGHGESDWLTNYLSGGDTHDPARKARSQEPGDRAGHPG